MNTVMAYIGNLFLLSLASIAFVSFGLLPLLDRLLTQLLKYKQMWPYVLKAIKLAALDLDSGTKEYLDRMNNI